MCSDRFRIRSRASPVGRGCQSAPGGEVDRSQQPFLDPPATIADCFRHRQGVPNMRFSILPVVALLAFVGIAQAQNTVTATCKDGSSWSGTSHSGACRGHGGVKTFEAAAPSTSAAAPATSTAAAPQGAPSNQPAPGGGNGQVWVNTASKVYHCPGDRYYGKTKKGTYMTESAAKAAGDRPANGKVCTSS
jgi:hypothetical protein